MRRAVLVLLLGLAAGLVAAPGAHADTRWLCRPGLAHDPCSVPAGTARYAPDGRFLGRDAPRTTRRRIDCFYVYPTVSGQPTVTATRRIDPELRSIARYQAARYSRTCRVYAPVYRQVTLAGLARASAADWARALADVKAAWRTYLRRFNHGRGVVLIGHSQGTFHLRDLLRQEIEPHRAQRRRLVSALLLGGNVTVAAGRDTGGDLGSLRACRSASQTRCVIAFSTFEGSVPAGAAFGRSGDPGPRRAVHEPGGARGRRRRDRPGRPEPAVRAGDGDRGGARRRRLPGPAERCRLDPLPGRLRGALLRRRRRARPPGHAAPRRTGPERRSRGHLGPAPGRREPRARPARRDRPAPGDRLPRAAVRLGVAAALVDGALVPGDVAVEGDRIAGVGLAGAGRGIAAPGFVDLQVNGFAGVDLMRADREGHARAGAAMLATGVTAYLPTFVTAPEEEVLAALRALPDGPEILGAHLEGPFLAPGRLGAHPPEWRRDPDPALLDRLLAGGRVTHVTLAPELPGAPDLIDALTARGITVAAGHSDATAAEAHAGFDRGHRHGHASLQRDAPPAAARPGDRARRARAAGRHRPADRRRPPRRRRCAARRLARRARARRARHRRGRRGRDGRRRPSRWASARWSRATASCAPPTARSPGAR